MKIVTTRTFEVKGHKKMYYVNPNAILSDIQLTTDTIKELIEKEWAKLLS